MAARATSLLCAAVGLAAAGALFTLGSEAPDVPPGLNAVAEELDGKLRETSAGVHARATTLADLPRLSAAVATDVPTVHNLTQDELAFRPQAGEVIEIAQVRNDGRLVSLLRIPADAVQVADLARAGVQVTHTDHGVMITEVVDIKPDSRGEIDHGALSVSWPLDTKGAQAKLEALGVAARVQIGGQTVLSTSKFLPPDAATVRARLAVTDGVVIAEVQPVGVTPLRAAAGGVALLSLILAGILWRRRAPAALEAAPAVSATPPPVAVEPVRPLTPVDPPRTPPEPGLEFASTAVVPASGQGPGKSARGTPTFGRYTVVRRIGSGGMAEVYLATSSGEAGFSKPVALKIMHSHLAKMPQIVEHFLDEARLASRLSHPNIVQIIDLGKTGDDYYIAMEFVDGSDLGDLMSDTRERGEVVPIPVALAILSRVCRGLHAAHAALAADGHPLDLVHRDVKAENIIVSRQGEVKISDFGIAKANQRQAQTRAGQVKGTTAYMSPEQRMGHAVDKRADVYGVGALAYELFAGAEINLDFEVLAVRGVEGWPHLVPASRVRADLPPELDAVIAKALSFAKEDRYASCQEMEEAIDAIAARHNLVASEKQLVVWMEHAMALVGG